MRVSKMVKNGFNSVSARFCRFEKASQHEEFKSRRQAQDCLKITKDE